MATTNPSTQVGSQGAKHTKRKWTPEEDTILVSCLTELHNIGKFNADTGFKAGYLLELERMFFEKLPSSNIKAKPHIESRIKTLKKEWGIIHDMVLGKDTSGFGSDEQKHMVYAEDAVWEAYLASHKEAAPFRARSFAFYQDLSAIYSKDRATGKDAQTVDDILEELEVEERDGATKVDTEGSAFNTDEGLGLDDINFVTSQPEPPNDGRRKNNSGKKKRNRDEGSDAYGELVAAARFLSEKMSEVGKDLCHTLGSETKLQEKIENLDHVLEGVDGLTDEERDLASLKLCDHPNKVVAFLGLHPQRRLQWIRKFLGGN